MPDPAQPVRFSVVVPFYNEEGAVAEVVEELIQALDGLGLAWEALLVDDGSRDQTAARLQQVVAGHPRCRVLLLPSNCGQGGALLAGIQAARGAVIGMMDGDGQNVPADFAALLAALERADLVVGIRAARHDSALRRVLSRIANGVRRRLLRDRVTDAGCALKVFRREIVGCFFPVTMLNPFLPAFAAAAGYRIAELPVRHRPRTSGASKYGLRVILWRPMLDMFAIWWVLRRRIPVERLPPAGESSQ